MSYQGFGKGSGPTAPPKSQPAFGTHDPFHRPPFSSLPIPPAPPFVAPPQSSGPSSIESSGWTDGRKLFYKDLGAHTPERPTSVTTFSASHYSMAGIGARVSRFPNQERIRSPISYADVDVLRNSGQTALGNNHSNSHFEDHSHLRSIKSQPPSLVPGNYHSVWNFRGPSISVQQPAFTPSTFNSQTSLSANYVNFPQHEIPSVPPYIGSQSSQQSLIGEHNSTQASKRTRSPPSPYTNIQDNVAHKDFRRPSISPPRLRTTSTVLWTGTDSQIHKKSLPSTVSEVAVSRPIISTVPKRTRSPPRSSPANEKTLEGNPTSSEDISEREMLAKAKRLARFKVELSKSEQNGADVADQKASANKYEQSVMEQKYVGSHLMDSDGNFTNGHGFSDYEGLEASNIIIGSCPDMCPESERGERERKGDLDQYERVDGDRNLTSKLLAVKKYNRTAEREASLIRPLPILEKTIDYLLTLLDQPYDERFLGIYNFLWDRMRAIRMDLRMQHIFNQEAITMLEQMIRLHIIAMHELCEYTKGEGFSEGFDAHLNIEQMNKTSVELFQMYDDHRKKGIYVPTEKEFRGYYALLKLDKHPGYKVEPAELSLDLAKMTPEIRQTPEVLFARHVARACRTGNFIAFFRLARKATYLQACLMHAHFAKLRTQALASLHSGVQNNQGLPVAHVANWLVMEDESIESLLEYHGFLLKAFEEPYMVKEGPFLNVDNDYPTKYSKLVHKKRSGRIIKDVSPSVQVESLTVQTIKEIQMTKAYKDEPQVVSSVEKNNSVLKLDEEMSDSEIILSPKDGKSGNAFQVGDCVKDHDRASSCPSPLIFHFPDNIPEPQHTRIEVLKSTNFNLTVRGSPKRNLSSTMDVMPLEIAPIPAPPQSSLVNSVYVPHPAPQDVSKDVTMLSHHNHNDEVEENHQDEEIIKAKLKLFLRLWRRRVSKLRMLREKKQLASTAALNSLPLGPRIRHYIDQSTNFTKFDIDLAMKERYEKQEKSWARLNISDVIAATLSRRNSDAKCFCWKVVLCSQRNCGYELGAAGSWLTSKLIPSSDDDMVISTPGLAIWRKWVHSQSGAEPSCCFSVIRDTAFGSLDETVSGASAVLFLVSESISWNLQSVHLHNLLMSIPAGSGLPLLILCGLHDEGFSSDIINVLGLQNIDKSRVSAFFIVFLVENQRIEHIGGFFSDRRLRGGLEWLAGESPLQPAVHCVKIRELVHMHLSSFSGMQESVSNSKLGPNDWISLFNRALDCSVQEIIAAANLNPSGWPCPEIGFIDKSSDEGIAVKNYLPTSRWSSNATIEPIIYSLQNCKLPSFSDDLFSWLTRGSQFGHEIENQRIQLENCLIQYLTRTSKMMGVSLATKEARVTMQTCARLELCGSSYRIAPHWGMIFRRIFNWRLMSLSSGKISSAYISECHHVASPSSDHDVGLEATLPSPYHLNTSLDELIGVSYNTSVNDQPRVEALQHLPQRISNDVFHDHETVNQMDAESNLERDNLPSVNAASTYANGEALVKGKATKEADRLSKLLEQCNLLQDSIDRKLSIYF